MIVRWFRNWMNRRACFHHDRRTGQSYVDTVGIFVGGKHFRCSRCGYYWT